MKTNIDESQSTNSCLMFTSFFMNFIVSAKVWGQKNTGIIFRNIWISWFLHKTFNDINDGDEVAFWLQLQSLLLKFEVFFNVNNVRFNWNNGTKNITPVYSVGSSLLQLLLLLFLSYYDDTITATKTTRTWSEYKY